MKKLLSIIIFTAVLSIAVGFCLCWHWQEDVILSQLKITPSFVLGFQPVDTNSSSFMVRCAQAELTRHQIECMIDGKFGKQTATGICELLCKFEKTKVRK